MGSTLPRDDDAFAEHNSADIDYCLRRTHDLARGLYPAGAAALAARTYGELDPQWVDEIARSVMEKHTATILGKEKKIVASYREGIKKRSSRRTATAASERDERLRELGRIWNALAAELRRNPTIAEARERYVSETRHLSRWRRGPSERNFWRYVQHAREAGYVPKSRRRSAIS